MSDWIAQLKGVLEAGEAAALVTVVAVEGSTPRDEGTKMIVTRDGILGTIGGGQLEYASIELARAQLEEGASPRIETFPLGPQLGQCCGGNAKVLFEALDGAALNWLEQVEESLKVLEPAVLVTATGPGATKQLLSGDNLRDAAFAAELGLDRPVLVGETWVAEWLHRPLQPLTLFGAGHVGRALVQTLAPLPFRVTWVDSRPEAFPDNPPANAKADLCDPQRFAVERAPAGSFYLVMTHSHAVDFELCEAVLRRDDVAYLGLIGSRTKRARFLSRLKARGITDERLARLSCPIGVPGISGKEPAVIAASVAVDLLQRSEALRQAARDRTSWASTAER